MRTTTIPAAVLAALLLSSIVQPVPALAQNAIGEIIVTARQREETLQDVPVTVAAFSEADIQRYNINTLTQLAKMVPNMQINQGGIGDHSAGIALALGIVAGQGDGVDGRDGAIVLELLAGDRNRAGGDQALEGNRVDAVFRN